MILQLIILFLNIALHANFLKLKHHKILPKMSIAKSHPANAFKYFTPDRLIELPKIEGLGAKFRQMYTLKSSIKCHVLSDLHADTEKSQQWCHKNCICEDSAAFNILILPGDVGSEMEKIESIFMLLVDRYDLVCYIPGNHEAWKRGENSSDSVQKLVKVVQCAKRCGVMVNPLRLTLSKEDGSVGLSVVILPLHAWYHSGWDCEPELTHPAYIAGEEALPFQRKWGDFSLCSWPIDIVTHDRFASTSEDSTALAESFGLLNEPFLYPLPHIQQKHDSPNGSPAARSTSNSEVPVAETKSYENEKKATIFGFAKEVVCKRPVANTTHTPAIKLGSPYIKESDTVISFSHFLPRQELCPEKRFLIEPLLAKVVGSDPLEEQIRRLQPHIHLFGHTHIPIDMELEGIRYIQWPLGYTREADRQCAPVYSSSPLMFFDSALGAGSTGIPSDLASTQTAWSRYYRANERTPNITDDLAPWVLERIEKYSGFVYSKMKRETESAMNQEETGQMVSNPI